MLINAYKPETFYITIKINFLIFKMFSKRFIPRTSSNFVRSLSNFIRVVEVGPRDGLQNEPKLLPTPIKIELINQLSTTGLKTIEATSFVSPKWIPQMQDNTAVFQGINKNSEISYPVLVPNLKGLESALTVGVKEIAIFGAASESFSLKNINCSIDESMRRFKEVIKKARESKLKIRGYVSCIAGCPYEGDVSPTSVAKISALMLEEGCYEISLGDTIGVGTPKKINSVLKEIKSLSTAGNLQEFAIHCHDTYGQAIANIYASLEYGIRVFDSSVAGLGGCPYAAGASGNVATEDLLYLLHNEGFNTGVDLNAVIKIGDWISNELGRKSQSKVGIALLAKERKK
ncbi:hydroxymethylglutaryl-CoA lyase, mitochondrial [Chelonus insularis]|uniref:hydroxymethylglutaryl-CoA lyase, mitochondrial n=1 Tax=Chelonus insularis TaxID=460826 RepID=UPI00158EA4CA|nr:hydroxymethylglutaryl-CoA lyase, mitochondrial [Chelonus insularis]